tara:strand:+ start:10652 stop:12289 length:1638 start_codon:yes stop_codon:yes gene_type:complete
MKKVMILLFLILLLSLSIVSASFWDFLTGGVSFRNENQDEDINSKILDPLDKIKKESFLERFQKFFYKEKNQQQIIYCSDSDGGIDYDNQGTVSGEGLTGVYEMTDYCVGGRLWEFYCNQDDFATYEPSIDCEDILGAGATCYNGSCIEEFCWDLDDGNYSIRGDTIFSDPNSTFLQAYTESHSNEIICENGTRVYEYMACDENTHEIVGACINETVEWDQFINWMDDKGYDPEIIDYYLQIYTNPDPDYAEYLIKHSILKNWQRHPDNLYMLYKNSQPDEEINLSIIEVYPTDAGWINKISTEELAANEGLSLEEYLQTIAEPISKGLGRDVNIQLIKRYIDYSEYFFCDDCYYQYVIEPDTVYVKNDTMRILQEDITWTEHVVEGYIDTDKYELIDEQRSFFISDGLVPQEAPGSVYVFMGGISPDNYFFSGFVDSTFTCEAFSEDSIVFCQTPYYIPIVYLHEIGHLLNLAHGYVNWDYNRPLGVPTVMLSSMDDWPCVDVILSNDPDYLSFAPIERYVIEPYSGFENEEEFVEYYNELLLC